MPAPRTDIDRAGICASVALKGIRPTAQQFNLPVATVRDIAKAGDVKAPGATTRIVRTTDFGPHGPHATPSAHAVITDELSALGAESRLAAAQIGASTLVHIAGMKPQAQLRMTQEAANIAMLQQRANVPGWERREQILTTNGDTMSDADLERILADALARLPELEAAVVEKRRLEGEQLG